MCILSNQRDATYTVFFIIISTLHVSGGFSAHHQELIKLKLQPWVFSCFSAVYRWRGWVGTSSTPVEMCAIRKLVQFHEAAHLPRTFLLKQSAFFRVVK
jgi:hypothetical protein